MYTGSVWEKSRPISPYKIIEKESFSVNIRHRRRMKTEAKAKVVASVWGENLFNSLPR